MTQWQSVRTTAESSAAPAAGAAPFDGERLVQLSA